MNLDRTKREARREAWYGEGTAWNPFRKTRTNTSTLYPGLQPSTSAPSPAREPRSSHNERPGSKEGNLENINAGSSANGRPSDPESETTVVDSTSTRNDTSEKAGLFSRFHKKKNTDLEGGRTEEDVPKKQPWYKGKELKHEPFTLKNQLGATILGSWINVLLIAAPVGIALNYAGVDGKIVFVVNFIAIIPLAGMLSFATEEIALHVGESLGGLLNASFG
jgi:Ca2+:H+ antiporter